MPQEKDQVNCPICEGVLDYVLIDKTHVWSCDSCPIVMLEFYTDADADALKKWEA